MRGYKVGKGAYSKVITPNKLAEGNCSLLTTKAHKTCAYLHSRELYLYALATAGQIYGRWRK